MDRRLSPRGWLLLQVALVCISGLLMWAAFPDIGWWSTLFISLFILFGVIRGAAVRRAAWLSALWAMVFFLPHISWMNVATNQTYLAWILLALAQAFFLGLWGAMYSATNQWRWARSWWGEALVVALLWVGIEQLRARVPLGGFPWAKLPYALVDAPLVHLAPIGGEVLVSAVAVVAVAFALHSVLYFATPALHAEWGAPVGLAAGAAALVVLPVLIPLSTAPQNGSVTVLAVQGNVEVPMQDAYAVEGHVTENHLRTSFEALEAGASPQLIMWGEDSVDRDPQTSEVTDAMVRELVSVSGVPLVAGFQEFRGDVRYNWYRSWNVDGSLQKSRYGKQHPVPWGEFVPWRSVSEFLAVEAAGISVDMVGANNPALLEVTLADGQTIPFAVGICFEAGDEQILAEGIRLGGQAVLIPTNNSHFRDTAESTQQLQMTRFRAVEFSRAALQISTNGVSAIIGPNGKVLEETGRQVAGYLEAEIALRTNITPAARTAERLPLEVIAASLMLGFAAIVVNITAWVRRDRRTTGPAQTDKEQPQPQ